MSELRFDGQVAIVTGAGRGLGRAYAELLGARGAKVVVNDCGGNLQGEGVDTSPASSVVAAIRADGGVATANFDAVGDEEAAQRIVKQALAEFGRIDILLNNAGNFLPVHGFEESTADSFARIYAVHTAGTINMIRAVLPHMKEQGYGRIVVSGSTGGYYGTPGRIEYHVAKGALHGLVRGLCHELSDYGICINLIAPGAITRPGTEELGKDKAAALLDQFGPDLAAPATVWLCHEQCRANGESFTSMAGITTRIALVETPGWEAQTPTLEGIRDNFADIRGESLLAASPFTVWQQAEEQGAYALARRMSRAGDARTE